MSVLGRRLAGTEGAYFFQESKHAVERLASSSSQKKSLPPPHATGANKTTSTVSIREDVEAKEQTEATAADVLPEILRHSLPLHHDLSYSSSSFSRGSKWSLLHPDAADNTLSGRGGGVMNPLRDYVSLPQATFGPKRWQLPDQHHSVSASTANELRRDRYTQPVDPGKLKAVAAELSYIGKAFAIATVIVFGGATSVFVFTAAKLQIQNAGDIRTKGRDLIQPKVKMIREHIIPLRAWAENMSRKWHIEGEVEAKENPIIKQLSKTLGGGRDF